MSSPITDEKQRDRWFHLVAVDQPVLPSSKMSAKTLTNPLMHTQNHNIIDSLTHSMLTMFEFFTIKNSNNFS